MLPVSHYCRVLRQVADAADKIKRGRVGFSDAEMWFCGVLAFPWGSNVDVTYFGAQRTELEPILGCLEPQDLRQEGTSKLKIVEELWEVAQGLNGP